ncbi:hypothetical protein BARVI_01180 [Barnesiella viscericola DSM 18177]|uniref:SPOR domain-containing protein n=1 Tax=Barnesiella viscericola DSM 18177 TaxID=880074 RepID=W0EWV2_9BACT|nr:SPOR domain-containing protein [Barnesiella viscericola]AHF13556.1 hypothetical protein BARVI_01180 [Barnesiella viscericola DSM 18177]
MIGIARHIEYLLLHHGRVTLPGIGTFAVGYREARLLPDDSSFLPPVRSVEFHPDECGDDERLLRSVMRSGFISRDEAARAIANEADAIRRTVEAGDDYRLGRLGRFVLHNGQIDFQVNETNFVEYPRLGFAPVEVQPLEEPEAENETAVTVEDKTPDRIYISFPRRILRAAAVAAAVIVFLLMLSKPINTPDTTVNYAGVLSAELFGPSSTVQASVDEAVVDTTTLAPNTVSVEAEAAHPATTVTEAGTTANTYYIIVSSLPSKRLAEQQIECFRQQGISCDLHIYETPRKARLYVASFGNFDEARQYLSQLVREQPLFENAWIMNAGD